MSQKHRINFSSATKTNVALKKVLTKLTTVVTTVDDADFMGTLQKIEEVLQICQEIENMSNIIFPDSVQILPAWASKMPILEKLLHFLSNLLTRYNHNDQFQENKNLFRKIKQCSEQIQQQYQEFLTQSCNQESKSIIKIYGIKNGAGFADRGLDNTFKSCGKIRIFRNSQQSTLYLVKKDDRLFQFQDSMCKTYNIKFFAGQVTTNEPKTVQALFKWALN